MATLSSIPELRDLYLKDTTSYTLEYQNNYEKLREHIIYWRLSSMAAMPPLFATSTADELHVNVPLKAPNAFLFTSNPNSLNVVPSSDVHQSSLIIHNIINNPCHMGQN